eukprot:UN00432
MSLIKQIRLQQLIEGINVHNLVSMIRIAETAERYDDMCYLVKQLVISTSENNVDLDVEQQNLFSVAFKNVVGSKRASWRTLSGGFDNVDCKLLDAYKNIIGNEIETKCLEVIDLLQSHLIKNNTNHFYYKMTSDYYRYLSEVCENEEYENKCEHYTDKAMECLNKLSVIHPTRLGLSLSYAMMYYEILKQPEKACDIAKKAFDDAIEHLDELITLNDLQYKDSTLIMPLLRDNLTLWTSDMDEK